MSITLKRTCRLVYRVGKTMLKLLTSTNGNAIVTSQATLARWTGVTLVSVWMHIVFAASTRSCANMERIR